MLVVRKLQKTAARLHPAGLAERVPRDSATSLRYFADEVRAGMAEREIELRDALGMDERPGPADDDGPSRDRRAVDQPPARSAG